MEKEILDRCKELHNSIIENTLQTKVGDLLSDESLNFIEDYSYEYGKFFKTQTIRKYHIEFTKLSNPWRVCKGNKTLHSFETYKDALNKFTSLIIADVFYNETFTGDNILEPNIPDFSDTPTDFDDFKNNLFDKNDRPIYRKVYNGVYIQEWDVSPNRWETEMSYAIIHDKYKSISIDLDGFFEKLVRGKNKYDYIVDAYKAYVEVINLAKLKEGLTYISQIRNINSSDIEKYLKNKKII